MGLSGTSAATHDPQDNSPRTDRRRYADPPAFRRSLFCAYDHRLHQGSINNGAVPSWVDSARRRAGGGFKRSTDTTDNRNGSSYDRATHRAKKMSPRTALYMRRSPVLWVFFLTCHWQWHTRTFHKAKATTIFLQEFSNKRATPYTPIPSPSPWPLLPPA